MQKRQEQIACFSVEPQSELPSEEETVKESENGSRNSRIMEPRNSAQSHEYCEHEASSKRPNQPLAPQPLD